MSLFAVIGAVSCHNYIRGYLSFHNDFPQEVPIEPETNGINIKLLVKLWRVAATLSGLAVFQVVPG